MKKKKHLKIFAAGALALFMGLGTLCGVLISPMNSLHAGATSASNAGDLAASAQSPDRAPTPQDKLVAGEGIINPQETDPVIFTTESGIDIKFGLASELSNSNLSGFFYITTTSGSTKYHWIIIGQNISSGNSKTAIAGTNTMQQVINGCHDKTPAGNAILSDYMQNVKYNASEIPANSVLCLANDNVATATYNSTYTTYRMYKDWYFASYTGNETIATTMEGYYNNKSFGLSAIYNNILSKSISTTVRYIKTSTDDDFIDRKDTITKHIFPLGARTTDTFYWKTYLSSAQMKLSSTQWLRGTNNTAGNSYDCSNPAGYISWGEAMDSSGSLSYPHAVNTYGYRPAFCLKLI